MNRLLLSACIGLILFDASALFAQNEPARTLRDWSEVPVTIGDSKGDDLFKSFSKLHELSYLTTNQVTPSCPIVIDWDAKEKNEYSEWAKRQWLNWWKDSGAFIDQQRNMHSVSYPKAWTHAIELTHGGDKNEPAPKIWIPDDWMLYLYFHEGDYDASESEQWIIQCSAVDSRFYRIKANGWNLRPLTVERCIDIKRSELTEFLAVITYVYEYDLRNPEQVRLPHLGSDNKTEYYYPAGLVRLDNRERSIWNFAGYEHHADPKLYSSKSRFHSNDETEPASKYELCDQRPGLARSIAMTLWNDKKSWRRVFKLGKEGRQLLRDTLHDPVFDKVYSDQTRFAVLAASGDEQDAEVIEKAIQQAQRVENEQASFREMVTNDGFTTRNNKWSLVAGKKNWQIFLEHLRSIRSGQAEIVDDQLMDVVATELTQFELLKFDASEGQEQNTISIPVGLK